MMKAVPLGIHTILRARYQRRYNHFMQHLDNAHHIQKMILLRMIRENQKTLFGERYQFKNIRDVKTFKEAVPVMTYEDYAPWIHQIKEGQRNVLTSEAVHLLEPTSGSCGGSKWIPYTASLKKEFIRAIGPWLADLYQRYPEIKYGTSYWSVSPALCPHQRTVGGIPVGFEDDTDYLDWSGSLMRRVLAVPPLIKRIKYIENFRYVTAYFLLRAEDLSLVSVWNPTFLTLIVESIETHAASLLKDIFNGHISLPIEEDIRYLKGFIKADPIRARALEALLFSRTNVNYAKVWKNLKLISCWMDGPSQFYVQKLVEKFPHVAIQGKGLIATEGVVSVPISLSGGCVPAYDSHFIEFQQETDASFKLIDELKENGIYRVIITTGGGLYRYDLQDKIRVIGNWRGLPLLEFLGRDRVSDLVGEKLNEVHVSKVIKDSLNHYKMNPEFVMLAPQKKAHGSHYALFIQLINDVNTDRLFVLSPSIDQGLKENFHYQYARDLNQLLPLQIFVIRKDAEQAYMRRCMSEGQRLGEIKYSLLDRRDNWQDYFEGDWYEHPSDLIRVGSVEPDKEEGR